MGPPGTRVNPPCVERSDRSGGSDARWDVSCWIGLAVVGTNVCLYLFHSRKNLINDLAAHGRHRTGVVTEATASRGRRGTSYHIHYQYVLPGGIYQDSKLVSEREARQASPGDRVDILYDPASPGRHLATSVAEAREDLTVRRNIMCVVAGIFWARALWRVLRAREAALPTDS
jgi:hypothetical protein